MDRSLVQPDAASHLDRQPLARRVRARQHPGRRMSRFSNARTTLRCDLSPVHEGGGTTDPTTTIIAMTTPTPSGRTGEAQLVVRAVAGEGDELLDAGRAVGVAHGEGEQAGLESDAFVGGVGVPVGGVRALGGGEFVAGGLDCGP